MLFLSRSSALEAGVTQLPPSLLPSEERAVEPLDMWIDRPSRRITVNGELDLVGAEGLTAAVTALHYLRPGDITIDLAAVTLIDGSGIGCLVGCNNDLVAAGAKLSITGASSRTRRLFVITSLDAMLEPA